MIAYLGDTRSHKLLAQCREADVGQIIVRGRLRGRRLSKWAYDNAAFEDWRQGKPFDAKQFAEDLATIETMDDQPAFCLLPDIVAGGAASLARSLEWLESHPRADWYLVVQDGMTPEQIPWDRPFVGIFVGGSLPWKLQTGAGWVEAAHAHSMPCHIGRVGTRKRVLWAYGIGADSIDSCLPLWSVENAELFFRTLKDLKTMSREAALALCGPISASAHAMPGSAKKVPKEPKPYVREKDDFYETPLWATQAILPHLPQTVILDPCAGRGAIFDALTPDLQAGFVAMELDPGRADVCRGKGVSDVWAGDALSEDWPNLKGALILTNPPYKHAQAFAEKAIATGATVAFLLRLGFLASKKRQAFHKKNPADIFILPKRPSFGLNKKGKKGTDSSEYAWFVWNQGTGGRWSLLKVAEVAA